MAEKNVVVGKIKSLVLMMCILSRELRHLEINLLKSRRMEVVGRCFTKPYCSFTMEVVSLGEEEDSGAVLY